MVYAVEDQGSEEGFCKQRIRIQVSGMLLRKANSSVNLSLELETFEELARSLSLLHHSNWLSNQPHGNGTWWLQKPGLSSLRNPTSHTDGNLRAHYYPTSLAILAPTAILHPALPLYLRAGDHESR